MMKPVLCLIFFYSADLGGEVERVLNMADGVLLVVDSVEGPKPQTRFVLDKALQKGMKALVVVNKIDRPAARPDYVVDTVFDLFVELGASDEQTDFRVVYASGLNGQAGHEPDALNDNMDALLDAVLESIDPPSVQNAEPAGLQALVSNIDFDDYKGKMGIARITNGSVKAGQPVALTHPNKEKKTGRLGNLFVFDNLGKREVEEAKAGEIIMFAKSVQTFKSLLQNCYLSEITHSQLFYDRQVNVVCIAVNSQSYLAKKFLPM